LKYPGILVIAMLAISLSSCKKKAKKNTAPEIKGTYFSINQFMLDEWNTFSGEPFMISKTVTKEGKTDSTLTNSYVINWAPLIKTFSETDISDPKFLGRYTYTQFDDNADGTHNFFYEANEDEDELYTRKLLITINAFTAKIKGIYIETEKKTVLDDCVQKLYYSPLKTVQIQVDDKPLTGSKTHTVTEYNFIR
jgi:hypothetical protein